MNLYNFWIAPFVEFGFMKNALFACFGLSITSGLLGTLINLKRMSLVGEALSHGILPGIAISYIVFGFWLPGFIAGAMLTGFLLSFLSTYIHKKTILNEDACYSGMYLYFLAIGILILSLIKGNFNIIHLLFGDILSVSENSVFLIFLTSLGTLVLFFFAYRPIVYDCFDPIYMKVINPRIYIYQGILLILIVMTLVSASITIGTLMGLGLIIIPPLIGRLLTNNLKRMVVMSVFVAILSSYFGLIASFHLNWPSGPSIILFLGSLFIFIFIFQKVYGLISNQNVQGYQRS